jgi:hypothetical protein
MGTNGMDFLRTLKKRRPKHVTVRANVVPSIGHRPKSRRIRLRRRGASLTLAFWLALLLCLAAVTEGQSEQYYIYQNPNGELVISNKEPPPGSKIIKQQDLPTVTDSEAPQAQEPNKTPPNEQTEGSPNASKTK